MGRSTQELHDRIVLVFDFDQTLGEGAVDVLLRKLQVDPERFARETVEPLLRQGWDLSLARFKALIDLSESLGGAVTESVLRAVGRDLPLYPEVELVFDRLRAASHAIAPGVEVEFHVLTAGFVEVPTSTAIAHEFKDIWGSAGHYAPDGRLVFPKRIITYPEKVHYLLQLAKGLSVEGPDAPADVFRHVPEEKWHVPFSQMIYVGDGASDLPAFELLSRQGGLSIGVFGPGGSASDWGRERHMHSGQRVQNVAEANYAEDAELMQSLRLGVEAIAKLIALRRLGRDE
jgi:hypothetical protein